MLGSFSTFCSAAKLKGSPFPPGSPSPLGSLLSVHTIAAC